MPYWLFKSEPDTWSWDQQVAKGAAGEEWRVPIDIRLYRELEPCGPVAETFWMNSTVLPRAGPDQG